MKSALSILVLGILAHGAFSGKIDSLLNSDGIFDNMGIETLSTDPLVALSTAMSKPSSVSRAYNNYLRKQNKTSDSSPSRKSIFKSNLMKIAAHNTKARNGKAAYELGVNQFTDMTIAEVIQGHTGYTPEDNAGSVPKFERVQSLSRQSRGTPPQSIDWRHYGLVTPVKNQGGCGSCVLFSVTACLESYYAITNGQKQIDLSEQELLDCAQGSNYPGNGGCGGNGFGSTFKYIRDIGETTEREYGYQEKQYSCRSGGKSHPAKTPGYWSIQSGNENALRDAVGLRGPVSVAIHVNDALMKYKSGIFDAPCSGGRNHAVLVVGYGSENGKDYWIVKNSWGGWGDQGYFKLRRNYGNMCDISGDAVSCNPNVEIALG